MNTENQIPEELANYDLPHKIFYGSIDEPLQELVWEINHTDWMCTTCSCAGHVNSEDIRAWSTNAIVLVLCYNNLNKFDKWINNLGIKHPPDRYASRELHTIIGRLLHGNKIDRSLEKLEPSNEIDGWTKRKIKYNFDTIGERNAVIDIMRESLREIET